MDAEGNVVAAHGGPRTVAGFEQTARKASAFLDLKKKAAGGDKASKVDLLIAEVELGRVKPEEAEAKLKALEPLTAEQKTRLDAIQVNAEVRAILQTTQPDMASRVEAGKKFLEMKKAGRPAPSGDQEAILYWLLITAHAEHSKDAATFEEALNALRAKLPSNPQAKAFLGEREAALKKLKGGG